MPKTSHSKQTSTKSDPENIAQLEAYIKAYNKQKQAQAQLDKAKKAALSYLKNNISENEKIKYKECHLTLCNKKTYTYSPLATQMSEALSKQKKIEQLSGEAKLKISTDYIRLEIAK